MKRNCQPTTRQSHRLSRRLCLLAGAVLAGLVAASVRADDAAWVFPPARPLRVNLVQGLWHRSYRLHAGLAAAGGAIVTESWDSGGCGSGWLGPGDQGGDWVWYFDAAPAGLRQQHVLIVANVNARSFHEGQQAIVDYVKGGGSVLFLGGRWALGKAYRDSPLAEICPVDFPGQGRWDGSDLEFRPQGVPVEPAADTLGEGFADLAWDSKPVLFWYHTVKPKAGSKTLLTVEGKPALVLGTAGKGRVAVFAGTVMGDAGPGQVPLWDWDGWPQILAATTQWLAEAPAAAAHELPADARALLTDGFDEIEAAFDGAADTEENAASARLLAVVDTCHTAAGAESVLRAAAALPGDIPPALVEGLDRVACPVLTREIGKIARQLLESGLAYKAALGLRVLGASRASGAVGTLASFLASGKVVEVETKTDLDDHEALLQQVEMMDSTQQARRQQAIRLAALAGLGHLGSKDARAELTQACKANAAGRLDPNKHEDQLSNENLLYQQALVSALRCGDETLAAEVVEMLMENIYVVARARTEANKSDDILAQVHSQIGWELRWQRDLYRQINAAPASVIPALAKALAAVKDRRAALIALAVFSGRELPDEARAALQGSPHQAVRLLGN